MTTRAAVGRVLLVAIDIRFAGAATSETTGVLELRRAIGVQVDGTLGGLAVDARVDADGDVEAIDEGNYVGKEQSVKRTWRLSASG